MTGYGRPAGKQLHLTGRLADGQTSPAPGGVVDKNAKGLRAGQVPLIDAIRDLVQR